MNRYANRLEAGRELADRLAYYKRESESLVVLALPRGGVPVAFPIAAALGAPLKLFQVRKVGVPGQEELAMGAIASGGTRFFNEAILRDLSLSDAEIEALMQKEEAELIRREKLFGQSAALERFIERRVCILVDDGLATGATMRAAVQAVKAQKPRRVVVAVPVGSASTCDALKNEVDELICPLQPEPFGAVGVWYQDFAQITDEEVVALLERACGPISAWLLQHPHEPSSP